MDILGWTTLGANAIGSIWNAWQQNKWSNKNNELQKETLDYQKYLNNNQIQMQTADAIKAGINPLAMNPGNLNSGNYSNVEAPQADLQGLSNIASTIMSNKTAEKNAQTQADTAKEVARINAESQERQTQMKINADTETQKEQNRWQKNENMIQRLFEANQNELDRKKAWKIADASNKLTEWLNTYTPTVRDLTSGTIEVDGEPNKKPNILSVEMDRLNAQVNQLYENEVNEQTYRSNLLDIQRSLLRLQEELGKVTKNTAAINSITNVLNSVTNAIDSINPVKPKFNIR